MPKMYDIVLTGDTRDGFKLELACKLEILCFNNFHFFLVRKKVDDSMSGKGKKAE